MSSSSVTFAPKPPPRPFDAERVEREWERWRENICQHRQSDQTLSVFMASLADPSHPFHPFMTNCFGNSPFLSECLHREPETIRTFVEEGPDLTAQTILTTLRTSFSNVSDGPSLMKGLRENKRRLALTAALADITGLWTLETVCATLSDCAQTALRLTIRHLLREGAAQEALVLPNPDDPEHDSGFVVLAMGKLGARELNFSSDIDIIVLFDLEKIRYIGPRSPHEFYVRLTRTMVRFMEERTADGYVFRTDLRLRPDPGSTALAITTEAAELYYESFGQNWERAAMIKARPVAGDIHRGEAFLRTLRPFVWRRSLDFYAIQDIHSIKRQINAHHHCGEVAVAGHNIKTGRGGIREIEFFTQTQQLIWGGREPVARVRRTLDALDALVTLGHVVSEVRDDLADCYVFLRSLEHRLQMIDDAQIQTLPQEPEKLTRIALFFGYDDVEVFSRVVRGVLKRVEHHYAHLFEDTPSLSEDNGNLVFTGHEDDPGTLHTLSTMGFSNAKAINTAIRGWHHGRFRSTRSTQARELLTELIPALLRALSRSSDPDRAFMRFDNFLSRLPAGIQVFSLFHANPDLLDLVAEIMGDAPRLAEILTRQPNISESLITSVFFDSPPDRDTLTADLDIMLETEKTYEGLLDICRLWANGHKFQVGVQTLRRLLDARQAGEALSAIADVVLDRLLQATIADFARVHGHVPNGGMVVVAMGKMGGREMTATSDLDLITVYDHATNAETSDGERPLSPSTYFIRLTQRFVNAITVMTEEGHLYEVDMRLRPSGSKGPLAVSLATFCRYNAEAAWTWEHMALTRARTICGPAPLRAKVDAAILTALTRNRPADALVVDVADMRALMARERKPSGLFDVKLSRGGLVDIEFIVQTLLLRHLPTRPALHSPNIAEAITRLREADLLAAPDAALLLEAQGLWLDIQGMLRHSVEGPFKEEAASTGLRDKLARVAGEPDLNRLKSRMESLYKQVYALFVEWIDIPAQEARQRLKPPSPSRQETI